MRIGYLVNLYPAVSHTFIRREIAAVEGCGLEVRRFSIRPPNGELVDPLDRQERARTTVILEQGAAALMGAAALTALGSPVRFLRALRAALRMGRHAHRGRLRPLAYLVEACLLLRRFRRDPVDHLHAHFATNPAAVALLCRLLGGPPYSFMVHGLDVFECPEANALREKARDASFVVSACDFVRGQVMRQTDPADWDKLRVVRCGVDRTFLDAPTAPPARGRRLLCVGRLSEEKGQLVLVEAADRLRRQGEDFEVVLVGDGPVRPRIEARIRALGLEGTVLLRGSLDAEGVRRELREARCLVVPSFAEGLPVVIMEAFALGRPAIGTFLSGIPELIQPGVNGWLVPVGSVEALAGAMAEALEAPPERLSAMGEAGARLVAERHDAFKEATRLVELVRASAVAEP